MLFGGIALSGTCFTPLRKVFLTKKELKLHEEVEDVYREAEQASKNSKI